MELAVVEQRVADTCELEIRLPVTTENSTGNKVATLLSEARPAAVIIASTAAARGEAADTTGPIF